MQNHIITTSRCSPDERTNPLHRSLINIFIRNETQDSTRHLPLGGGGGSLIINNSSPYIIKFRANDIIHLIYQYFTIPYKNNEVLIFQVEVFISSLFLKFVAKEYFHLKYQYFIILIGFR